MTPHALMLDAIEERVAVEEERASLIAEADERYATWNRNHRGIAWRDLREHLKARASGAKGKRPVPLVAEVVIAEAVTEDFERILRHLEAHASEAGEERIGTIIAAIDVLERRARSSEGPPSMVTASSSSVVARRATWRSTVTRRPTTASSYWPFAPSARAATGDGFADATGRRLVVFNRAGTVRHNHP